MSTLSWPPPVKSGYTPFAREPERFSRLEGWRCQGRLGSRFSGSRANGVYHYIPLCEFDSDSYIRAMRNPQHTPLSVGRRSAARSAAGALLLSLLHSPAVACLPPDVFVPVRRASRADAQAARAAAATILIDVSGSMAGYVAPPRPAAPARHQLAQPVEVPEPRVFRDLVLSLPQIAAQVADKVTALAFGRAIRPLPLSDLAHAGQPAFYRDAESRIGDALARMEALPGDEVGVLLTDLFLTGEEVFGGAAAIRAPLGHIMADGRSVGLMGIRSGFAGTIFDIPGGRTYNGATERPFYVVATGPLPAVARLLRRIEVELLAPLPPPPDSARRFQVTIYTKAPISGGPLALAMLPEAPAVVTSSLTPGLAPEISQFSLPGAAGAAAARIPLADLAIGPVLFPDIFTVEETVWAEASSRAACSERWLRYRSLPRPLATVSHRNGTLVLSVGGSSIARLPPGVPFLVRAKVTATGISEAPAATAWTRAWSLEAREAAAFVASRPRLFRTLHLREIAAMLESLVREDFQPQPIGEALLAVQVPSR